MRLYVYVLEARGLPAPRGHGGGLFYAKVTVGKQRFRTRAVEAAAADLTPVPGGATATTPAAAWNEEFAFPVAADEAGAEEFEVAVARRRRRGGRGREVVGAVRLPVPAPASAAAAAAPGERRSVPPTWFTLQPPVGGRRKGGDDGDAADCGKILLSFSLYGENNDSAVVHMSPSSSSRSDTDAEIERSVAMDHSGSNGGVVDSPRSRDTEWTSLDNSDHCIQEDSNSITEDDALDVQRTDGSKDCRERLFSPTSEDLIPAARGGDWRG